MNIFLRELKANRKSLIIWSICMFLLIVSGMAKYTAYSSGGVSAAVFTDMPRSIKAMLGFGPFDVTKASGFFAFLFVYIELTVAIHAALLGAGIIAKEESDKTTEFLMIKPVSRATIITSKLSAALINIIVINIVSLVSSIMMVASYNKGADASGEIAMFIFSMFFVQLIFLSLGAALAAFMRNPKSSGSLATGILIIGYFVARITDMTDNLNFLNLISPFKYFNIVNLYAGKGLNIGIVLLSLALVAVFTFLTYFFYKKRDLKV
jgi:ABC-2 type transport system permease protein